MDASSDFPSATRCGLLQGSVAGHDDGRCTVRRVQSRHLRVLVSATSMQPDAYELLICHLRTSNIQLPNQSSIRHGQVYLLIGATRP